MDYEDSQDLVLIMYYDLPKGNMEYRQQITLTRQDIFLLEDHITFLSYSITDEKYCSVEGNRGNYVRNDGAAREPGVTQMETRECWDGGADIRTVLGISEG